MLKNRLKLIIVIFFTISYMLCALLWWTIALTKLQTNEFSKDVEITKLKKSLVVNDIILSAKRTELNSKVKVLLFIENQLFNIDTNLLNKELLVKRNNFVFFYRYSRQHKCLELRLKEKDDIHLKLLTKLESKKKAWILEGLTMGIITIIIGIAMFVYLDRVVRLNQQQNNFLLAVTHELKTPIAASNLALQTAIKRPDPLIVSKMISMAQSNISRLSQMVEQILMATRFENKFTDPQKVSINLNEFTNKTLKSIELSDVDFQRIKINIDTSIHMNADEQMISTVIVNLVNNAIKYSDGEGDIKIQAFKNGNNLTIEFSDNGIGIPDNEKKNVFQKFYRVGEEKTRTKPGSGLGLFLVKRITEIHGGKVAIENNMPKGTKFILTFQAQDSTFE
jgi:signal transduction histidine kinase